MHGHDVIANPVGSSETELTKMRPLSLLLHPSKKKIVVIIVAAFSPTTVIAATNGTDEAIVPAMEEKTKFDVVIEKASVGMAMEGEVASDVLLVFKS